MSEKKRQKKAGHDKNKLEQARRQDKSNKKAFQTDPQQQAKDESNLNEVAERK